MSLSRPSCVISDPLKAELFKLFQLLLGAVVWTVAAFNPIQQVSFDLLDTEVRTLLLDVFDRLLKSELSRIRPDQPALLEVDVKRPPSGPRAYPTPPLLARPRASPSTRKIHRGRDCHRRWSVPKLASASCPRRRSIDDLLAVVEAWKPSEFVMPPTPSPRVLGPSFRSPDHEHQHG
jgi:hypothetical protein